MRTILTTALLVLSISSKGQKVLYADLFENAINSIRKTDFINYVDSSLKYFQPISRYADRKGKLQGFYNTRTGERASINFSRAELKEIDNKMGALSPLRWPDSLFANSKRLNEDSLSKFTSYMYVPRKVDQEIEYRWYYLFSQPIFIRNGNIAVFRMANMISHSSGYSNIFIYENREAKWARVLTIQEGAW